MIKERKIIKIWRVFILLVIFHSYQAKGDIEFAGGTGEPNDPFQIATAEQLISIGSDPNLLDKHFILINNIDLDPNLPGGLIFNRSVIASGFDAEGKFNNSSFTGSFDGHGHRIKNLTMRSEASLSLLGLFGIVGGRIRNLVLENVSIKVSTKGLVDIGGLVGCMYQGKINNCYVTGNISSSTTNIQCIGGLVGLADQSIISNCYSAVNISGGNDCKQLGGLLGGGTCWINNCYATGNVSGGNNSRWLGGLVGSGGSTLSNCYASGSVLAGDNSELLGGLVGQSWGHLSNCYFLTPSDGDGPDNGEGLPLTEEQMKQQTSFVGWDFDNIWTVDEGMDYPKLRPNLPEPPNPSPPDLSLCTKLEVKYDPYTLEYICRSSEMRKNILNSEEVQYLQSLEVILDDQKNINEYANEIGFGVYSGTGGSIALRPANYVVCYHNGERITSLTDFGLYVCSEEGHWFKYDRRFVTPYEITPQIRPFQLRTDCAINLWRLFNRIRSYLSEENEYPQSIEWCDVLVRYYQTVGSLSEEKLRKELKCPSACEGDCHYAMNPNCEPNSLPDMVLLFETKASWNQHGGPELFTFDNHDSKGGCVLLNDGTVKFIRTEEELHRLRWK
jgi:hypothetical protein